MRLTPFILASVAIVASALPLYAHKPIEVPWDQLCQAVAPHEIGIKTATGKTVYGYCAKVDADTVTVSDDDDRPSFVDRNEVARIRMYPTYRSLHDWAVAIGEWLDLGFHSGFSGLVLVPATLVVGAVAAPYCAIVDLRAVLIGSTEIQPK